MFKHARFPVFAVALLLLLNSFAPAQMRGADSVAADPATRRFARQLIAVTKAKDLDRLNILIHPSYLPCIASDRSGFFDDYFARVFKRDIPSDYKLWMGTVEANAPLLFEDAFSYPVRPTGYIEVSYEIGAYGGGTIREQVVNRRGRLSLVVPCPKPETLRKFSEMKTARQGSE